MWISFLFASIFSPWKKLRWSSTPSTYGHRQQPYPHGRPRLDPLRRTRGLDARSAPRASLTASTAATAALVVLLGAVLGSSGLELAAPAPAPDPGRCCARRAAPRSFQPGIAGVSTLAWAAGYWQREGGGGVTGIVEQLLDDRGLSMAMQDADDLNPDPPAQASVLLLQGLLRAPHRRRAPVPNRQRASCRCVAHQEGKDALVILSITGTLAVAGMGGAMLNFVVVEIESLSRCAEGEAKEEALQPVLKFRNFTRRLFSGQGLIDVPLFGMAGASPATTSKLSFGRRNEFTF